MAKFTSIRKGKFLELLEKKPNKESGSKIEKYPPGWLVA